MNSIRILQILIVSLAFSGLFTLRALAATGAAESLGRQLANLNSFTADFKQTVFDVKQRVIQRSQGRVKMLRPGRFWWETLEPSHQLLITNGKTLWIYDVELEQVTQDKIANNGNLSPGQLLSGSVLLLRDQFKITQESTGRYLLKPKDKNSEFKWVRLQFDNKQLVRMEFANQLAETNVFEFANMKINLAIDPNTFEFKAPAGVDVLVNQ